MTKEICQDCGKTFIGGPHAFYCNACRRKRQSEAAKARGLNKMGSRAHSEKCAAARKEREK